MKLIEREMGIEIEIKENVVSVLVLEDISLRLSLIEGLYSQLNEKTGNWLLVEDEKSYELAKYAEIILEPFSLELNGKRIKTKLYQELNAIAEDYLYLQGLEVHSQICNYLENLLEKTPYPLTYKEEWSALEILKGYGVELSDESDNVYEKLCNYINLMGQLCGIHLFIIVNLKQYLSEEQLLQLYKMTCYNKVQLILIEFNTSCKRIECEEMYILDKDDCIIIY